MRSLIPLSLLLTLLDVLAPATAFSVPFTVRTDLTPPPNRRLARRGSVPITNNANAAYIANISLAGVDVAVILDTGSSDLWVSFPGTPPSTKDTGTSLSLNYAVGSASGNIHTAELQFANYTVADQAFLQVANSSSFSSNSAYDGLVGLGPSEGSSIQSKIDGTAGDTMLNRIFQQDKLTQNYITFLLDRKNDAGETFKGQFSVGEPVAGFENITNQQKLNVETVHKLLDDQQHWQALTDVNAIVGPDGNVISIDSIVPKAPDGQLVAVFDSGFTFSQVPRSLSDAIYGRVQGAAYDETNEWWTVPCGQELNVTIHFGGVAFPIHPLDVVDDNFKILDKNGNHVCIGAFQPITSAFSLFGNFDMIMGMTFLRNAYTLMDFGDWVDGASNDRGDPFIQLLPTTARAAAHADFVNARLAGTDTTGAPQYSLLPASQQQHSPVSAEEKKKMYEEMILSRWPYILVGCLVGVILIVGLIVWRCCCRRGKCCRRGSGGSGGGRGFNAGKARTEGSGAGTGMGMAAAASESYLPLQRHGSPNPGASATHLPQQQQYHPQQQQEYYQQGYLNQQHESYHSGYGAHAGPGRQPQYASGGGGGGYAQGGYGQGY